MNDYSTLFETNNPDVKSTESTIDYGTVTKQYDGVPEDTVNESKKEEMKEFEVEFFAPKKVEVKRYKLKKL